VVGKCKFVLVVSRLFVLTPILCCRVNILLLVEAVATKIILEFVLSFAFAESALLCRVIQFLRFLRIFMLFVASKRMQYMAHTFASLVVMVFFFGVVMFTHFYFFSMIGMEIFSGIMVPSNQAIVNTDFHKMNYYTCCTFNDFPTSMSTLFHLMVVNNWQVTMRAHCVAFGEIAIGFFLIFYFTTVTILMNLLVALFIESFMFKMDEFSKRREKHKNAATNQAAANSTVGGNANVPEDEDDYEIATSMFEMSAQGLQDKLFNAASEAKADEISTSVHEIRIEREIATIRQTPATPSQ